MNAKSASLVPLPVPLRSEAFPEDILEFVERVQPAPPPTLGWLATLAPAAVALLGLAFAVVPPLA